MLVLMRIEDADLRRSRLALMGELPERERGAEQIFRRILRDIGERHIGVELPDEGFDLGRACAFDPAADEADDLIHQLLFEGLGFHDCPDLGIQPCSWWQRFSEGRAESSATGLRIPGK
jgi:hypothetical protein